MVVWLPTPIINGQIKSQPRQILISACIDDAVATVLALYVPRLSFTVTKELMNAA